jgi:hypothetical protein
MIKQILYGAWLGIVGVIGFLIVVYAAGGRIVFH